MLAECAPRIDFKIDPYRRSTGLNTSAIAIVSHLLPLACLAPEIVEAILGGSRPADLAAGTLIKHNTAAQYTAERRPPRRARLPPEIGILSGDSFSRTSWTGPRASDQAGVTLS